MTTAVTAAMTPATTEPSTALFFVGGGGGGCRQGARMTMLSFCFENQMKYNIYLAAQSCVHLIYFCN